MVIYTAKRLLIYKEEKGGLARRFCNFTALERAYEGLVYSTRCRMLTGGLDRACSAELVRSLESPESYLQSTINYQRTLLQTASSIAQVMERLNVPWRRIGGKLELLQILNMVSDALCFPRVLVR